ncbi:MAG TPA: hypothetical protein VJ785_15395 [Anaerolineales bacterium]|nr:hypothetical protein [Anaerolineales bacterium]
MKRIPWDILLAFLAGLGIGLVYAWMINPLQVTDATPAALRADFKDHYRSAIAAAYAATGNLPRAQARISLLNDPNPIEALNAQAQRMLASGNSFQMADQVVALARVLEDDSVEAAPTAVPATEIANNIETAFTATIPPPSPDATLVLTETPPSAETQPVLSTSTARPTQTPIPTAGAPFTLTSQDEICDANLPDGLLQVIVLNSNRRQMPGMEIDLTWEGGEEHFFTGLKPELGNGYADSIMTPDVAYTVQLAVGSDIATGLTPPTCQTESGENYFGGIKLTFQRP